ncbi:carbon-nitrogen hydrolase family protein [Planctomycetota bacterium]
MKIKIAQIKTVPEPGNIHANHHDLMRLLRDLAAHKPDVVVTPECFLDGYISISDEVTGETIGKYGIDPASSKEAQEWGAWAARTTCWLVVGCTRKADDGVFNSALAFDREGKLALCYDKVHLQAHDKKFCAGSSLPVIESDFGPFGLMLCADRRWPETVRSLALGGARIIFNPSYGMHDERNLRMMQTRSYESEVFIAFTHPGQSLITGPTGDIVCNNRVEGDRYTITEVSLSEADAARADDYGHLKDRRPDAYNL